MVVNYDLPLMNERDRSADERPDVETYIHRIGMRHFSLMRWWYSFIRRCVLVGRTGRFGRKGISINFVHDKKTWLQMEQIEKSLGKKIIRIETNDLDEMEEVRSLFSEDIPFADSHWCAENEEGFEIIIFFVGSLTFRTLRIHQIDTADRMSFLTIDHHNWTTYALFLSCPPNRGDSALMILCC